MSTLKWVRQVNDSVLFSKIFARRTVICFFITVLLFMTCILRVAVISSGNYKEVQTKQSSYRITVSNLRGTIFDCNMTPLTNATYHTVAAVSPTPRGVVGASRILNDEEKEQTLKRLSDGKPIICNARKKINSTDIAFATVYEHCTCETPASHIIGYTDSSGHGVTGLEYAYDSILYSDKTVDAVFSVDGKGNVLGGVSPCFENDTAVLAGGLKSTIDVNIQNIAEKVSDGIDCGAVVVAEANSGKIRAMVSRPNYDLSAVSDYLTADNSPLLNRAITAYSVGSVFKPCVAAAALDLGKGGFCFNCTGSTYIIDRTFNCHKRDGHGFVDLQHALAFSCNTFFYNFAINTGAEAVYKKASALNFGTPLRIADGIKTADGNLTKLDRLSNDATLANLSIGQGDLLLSPVSMLTLYCSIASNGTYYIPSIVEGIVKDGKLKEYDKGKPTRVMSEDTANTLKNYLSSVITEGTGTLAQPSRCTASGKTATAQTGRYDENGIEITNSWFCGFFPAENPKYVAIVMCEGKPKVATALLFSQLADGIAELYF